MSLRIEQKSRQKSEDRWDWSVWVAGKPKELAKIDSVTYVLHPTFSNPVRVMRNRAQKFRLNSSGWGEFTINVEIRRKDGKILKRSHALKLDSPKTAARTRTIRKSPMVFLSSSAADSAIATSLRKELQAKNVTIFNPADIEQGLPWKKAIMSAIRSADATIAILSDATSPWVFHELGMAAGLNIPILLVLVGQDTSVPMNLKEIQAIRLDNLSDTPKAADQLANRLQSLERT